MKKRYILLLPLLLITSACNKKSSTTPVDEETLFNNFETQLRSLEGHVVSSQTSLTRKDVYSSISTVMKDESTKTRYTYNDSYLVETKGNAAIMDDDGVTVTSSSAYTIQITNDSEYFYKVIKYDETGWGDSTDKVAYTDAGVALNYNIGFAQDDITNIDAMKQMKDSLKYDYSYTNFEGVIEDNKLHYTYTVNFYTIYDGGVKAKSQSIAYDNTLTIENNVVTKLEQKYSNILYYSEQAVNKVYVNSTVTYTQGQYTKFTGTVLPH